MPSFTATRAERGDATLQMRERSRESDVEVEEAVVDGLISPRTDSPRDRSPRPNPVMLRITDRVSGPGCKIPPAGLARSTGISRGSPISREGSAPRPTARRGPCGSLFVPGPVLEHHLVVHAVRICGAPARRLPRRPLSDRGRSPAPVDRRNEYTIVAPRISLLFRGRGIRNQRFKRITKLGRNSAISRRVWRADSGRRRDRLEILTRRHSGPLPRRPHFSAPSDSAPRSALIRAAANRLRIRFRCSRRRLLPRRWRASRAVRQALRRKLLPPLVARDDRHTDEAADHRGQCAFHPATTITTPAPSSDFSWEGAGARRRPPRPRSPRPADRARGRSRSPPRRPAGRWSPP